MNINQLRAQDIREVHRFASELNLNHLDGYEKQDIIAMIVKQLAERGDSIFGTGVLEVVEDGFGFLRSNESSYLHGADDIYISQSQIRRFNLRTGDTISGEIRPPQKSERHSAMLKIAQINFAEVGALSSRVHFNSLIPQFPRTRLTLEFGDGSTGDLTGRMVDLIAPIGKGQRGLIVAPPKAGKTIILQRIAQAIRANNPDCRLLILLIDERPEEVTEMKQCVDAEVIASTFDEGSARHVQVAEMVIEAVIPAKAGIQVSIQKSAV
ncbi:MAG: transcription termination factor Rho [Proteobacteria bacterium]|nr:transcription termination factor Rho [Pseudomonadota bacterium]